MTATAGDGERGGCLALSLLAVTAEALGSQNGSSAAMLGVVIAVLHRHGIDTLGLAAAGDFGHFDIDCLGGDGTGVITRLLLSREANCPGDQPCRRDRV